MKIITDHILGFIFPDKTASSPPVSMDILLDRSRYDFIEIYPSIYTICRYKDSLIRGLVHKLKFKGDEKTASLMGSCMARHIDLFLKDLLHHQPHVSHYQVIIIPVPASKRRERSRGWNQCEILARHIPPWSNSRLLVNTHLLKRTETTDFQKKLSRKERLEAQKDSFILQPSHAIERQIIIVIDDVVTTGATLQESIRTLTDYGYQYVFGFAFSH